jgi:hypothetical protein
MQGLYCGPKIILSVVDKYVDNVGYWWIKSSIYLIAFAKYVEKIESFH